MQLSAHKIASLVIGFFVLFIFGFSSCAEKKATKVKADFQETEVKVPFIDSNGNTIQSRFQPPQGFQRIEIDQKSFGHYLRSFPLLADGSSVHLYYGQLKADQSVHAAVLDIDVGTKDLQQCADAVMRLRAEYLYQQKRYREIAFEFTNRWKFGYAKWREGYEVKINGNNTYWVEGSRKKESYADFRNYLEWVFMYAGTLSLSNELQSKALRDIEIGDVFIKGGSPGHAVLVVDVARSENTGQTAFMLAQSYMPAQQIHILKNFGNEVISPWYKISEIENELNTPEWSFSKNSLKEW